MVCLINQFKFLQLKNTTMKSLKMLMMAAFSILTITAFAQNQSNKELMKAGVMKIQPQYTNSKEAPLVAI
jgi:hypothetical protein